MPARRFEHNAAFLVNDIARMLNRAYDERMATLGLTRAQWWVLARLYFNDGVTQTELAAELGFSKAALGGLLDRLQAKGWIERRAHARDRRAWCIHSTSKVEAVLTRMRRIAEQCSARALRGLTAVERRALVAMLARLRRSLLSAAARPGAKPEHETGRPRAQRKVRHGR